MVDVIHSKCYFTCSESQNNISLKTAQNLFPTFKFFFHKETLMHGQAIVDIADKKYT